MECQAVTSQIDLLPTLLGAHRQRRRALAKAGAGLKGRDFSALLAAPEEAAVDTLRPAALFNYNMLASRTSTGPTDAIAHEVGERCRRSRRSPHLLKDQPDFQNRCAIRSVFDGRYRFSRYFGQTEFNRPTTWEELFGKNDVELYDLATDPDEIDNLAMDRQRHGDLVMAMNAKLNARIDEEVGEDDGSFLPIRDGKWYFPIPRTARAG